MHIPKPLDARYEPIVDSKNSDWMDVGGLWVRPCNIITAMLYGFKWHEDPEAQEYYFWRLADELWNNYLPEPLLVRHPWAEQMIREALANKYLAIGGAASSAKSHTLAAFGIICWLSAPADTLVLITSTSLQEARKRIWGSVIDLLTVVEEAPCRIRDSIGSAAYVNEKGNLVARAGLSLIAAEKSRTKEATGKLIGIKRKNVILLADELSELSHAIVATALSNMSKNPNLRIIGMSNPASRFDAFGNWSEPEKGWESVDVMVADEWTTKWGGKYIRLDGERSPNIIAGEVIYPFLPTAEKLEEDRRLLGTESRAYMRMVRAVFFDSDEAEGVYSESDIANSGAMSEAEWQGKPVTIAGLDPAFTNGGDRTVLYTAKVGYVRNGQFAVQLCEALELFDDANNKAIPRTYQIVQQVMDICRRRNIPAENLAVDATGAGSPFCDVLAGEWSPDIVRVSFGGKASNKRVSSNSKLTGEELYMNRVTEIWFVGKEFMRTKQLYGVSPQLAREMGGRRYTMMKSGTLRMRIEPKTEFKQRLGQSPDLADAAFLAIDLARQRFGLVANELEEDPGDSPHGMRLFRGMRQRRTISSMATALENPAAEI